MSLSFVGSPDFHPSKPPSPARHSTSGSRRSRATSLAGSVEHRLSIIEEDNPSPPLTSPPPPKAHNRPFSRRFLGEPPGYSSGQCPPRYTFWDVTGPKGEKFEDLRNNAYIAKRGGWKRICIVGWFIVILAIALAVGLGVGLSQRHKNSKFVDSSAPAPSPSPSASPQTGPFPAGSYTFTTFLNTISKDCTSNSASWSCEPSVTYESDPVNSKAQFNWIITATNTTPAAAPNFTISSTNNPFAIDFKDASLNLMDEGTDTERYTFETQVQKIVFPTNSFAIKCFYNDTQFSADLYTKKTRTFPSNATTSPINAASATTRTGNGASYAEWEFAVDAAQSIGGGVDVPDCYQYNNRQIGAKITSGYEEQELNEFCSCTYRNYDG
ncbi:MAG: hypothetical protein Q9217_005295 [Psora testacea]